MELEREVGKSYIRKLFRSSFFIWKIAESKTSFQGKGFQLHDDFNFFPTPTSPLQPAV